MGKLKWYNSGKLGLANIDYVGLQFGNISQKSISYTWRDTSGTERTVFMRNEYRGLLGAYIFASSTTEETFNENDYSMNQISNVAVTPAIASDTLVKTNDAYFRSCPVTVKNNTGAEVSIPSITSRVSNYYSSSSNSTALQWCYIFDTPLVLAAGESITLVFNIGYKLPTND